MNHEEKIQIGDLICLNDSVGRLFYRDGTLTKEIMCCEIVVYLFSTEYDIFCLKETKTIRFHATGEKYLNKLFKTI